MGLYSKLFCASIVFLVIAVIILIFSLFIFNVLINAEAKSSAVLASDNADLWAEIPGKSKVNLLRDQYFYDIQSFSSAFGELVPATQQKQLIQPSYSNSSVSTANLTEKGPYRHNEYIKLINRNFTNDSDIVNFNYFRFFGNNANDSQHKFTDIVTTLNLPAFGVWHQVKNAPQNQVALQAIYTVVKGLKTDFYWQVSHKMLNATTADFAAFKLAVLPKLTHLSVQVQNSLYYDPYYGFKSENGLFIQASAHFPSSISTFFSNYFELTDFEMAILQNAVVKLVKKTGSLAFPYLEEHGGYTIENLMAFQWLNCTIASESVKKLNQSTPGFIEYGAYLSEVEKTNFTSKLTIEKVKSLLAYNTFDGYDKLRKTSKFSTNVDDSTSLVNKKNLDDFLAPQNKVQAIILLNNRLNLNDTTEALYLYNYLDYISGEMPYQYSKKGTKGIGGISQLVAPYLGQLMNDIGWSLFLNWLKLTSFHNYYSIQKCNVALNQNYFWPGADVTKICQIPGLDISKMENLNTWIKGVLFADEELKKKLECSDTEYLYLTGDGSKLKQELMFWVNNFMTIYKDYIIGTNYKSANFMNLGGLQWVDASFTKQFAIEAYRADSISDINWDIKTFPSPPELENYCQSHGFENKFTYANILPVFSFDLLFSSKFIQSSLINAAQGEETLYSNKGFIGYIKYTFINNILGGVTMKKSVFDLLYGYEDPFLKMMSEMNYLAGGDPTINPIFSLLNNMTDVPNDPTNKWSFYTGKKDYAVTRQYVNAYGAESGKVAFRKEYFDGKKTTVQLINPWNKSWVPLNGTDLISVKPDSSKSDNVWGFVDDLYRTIPFKFYKSIEYKGLNANRFLLADNAIQNATKNPYNAVYFSPIYNGMANVTSIYQAPMFASKPYYYQCDNIGPALPNIKQSISNSTGEHDKDDEAALVNESFIDVEVYSGGVLRAAQKLLLSLLIVKDDLFNVQNDMFIPILYTFRGGNFTDESVTVVFGDLKGALSFKTILLIIGIVLTVVFIAALVFTYIKRKAELQQVDSAEGDVHSPLNKQPLNSTGPLGNSNISK